MPAPPAQPDPDRAYTPAEVAALLGTDARAVKRRARAGRFPEDAVFRTPGGHRRYRADYIDALLNGGDAA